MKGLVSPMTKKILPLFFISALAIFPGCGSSFKQLNPINPTVAHAAALGNFYSQASVTNPPYGLVAGIFNHGTTPIYLDEVTASVGPSVEYNPITDGYIGFGFGLSNVEEDQCQTAPINWDDSTRITSSDHNTAVAQLVASSADTSAHVQQQGCTPHGMAYGAPLGGGMFNYTPTNVIPIKSCWGEDCSLTTTRTIAPGTGVTVYISRYVASTGAAFGISGKAVVNFRWHQ